MGRNDLVIVAVIFAVLAGLTSVASRKIGEPDREGAVAIALRDYLQEFVGPEAIAGEDPDFPPVTLCLDSDVRIDIRLVARELADTTIRPVPATECLSERTEGDFGMFTAITEYFDAQGEEAAHLEIADVSCPSTTNCAVDIDSRGFGDRFEMKRSGKQWKTVKRTNRWIV